jgi:type IV pilus assembly protein PilM
MRSPRILAVDLGAGQVTCGVFGVGATGRLVLHRFAREAHRAEPGHAARWAAEVARALGAIAAREKLGGACALAVPGHLTLTQFIKTPSIEPAKRGNIMAFEAAENIPAPLEEIVWDYLVVADDGLDLEVMLTAAKSEAMEAVGVAADAAGFRAERAIPAGLALREAFRARHPGASDRVIVANIGARTTTLLFLDGGRFYLRTLPLAGHSVTTAIAGELRIDVASAEALKVQVLSGRSDLPAGSPSRAAVHRAAENFAGRLAREITRTALHHRRQSGAGPATVLYLAGAGSLPPDLPGALAEKLQLRIERYDPLHNVEVSADARAAGAEGAAAGLAHLVGLASCLIAPAAPEASLLPPERARDVAGRKKQPCYLAAAALLAIALLPPIVYFHRVTTATLAQAAQVERQLRPWRARQTRTAGHLAQIEDAKRQIAALHGAVASKSAWLNFFTDLQTRLGKIEDVWLDRLEIVRPPMDVAAAAADSGTPQPAAPDPAAGPPAGAPLRLALSGRLLDVANPRSRVSPEARERVTQLLASFAGSPFIAAVENEKFDNNQNGLLRFDFMLVLNPRNPR